MYRHSPIRSHRSKGFKLKHFLQICVLVAVCFWLIYQVKHSHDKRKEFDKNDAKIAQTTQRHDEILNFGRKQLNPQVKETSKEDVTRDEEDAEEETGGEDDDNKMETKEEDESKEGGDEDLDENDQGKNDSELDHEEEFLDEEKAREEDEEKEIEEKDLEDLDSQAEKNRSSVDGHDPDVGTTNTHEAREEQYKADDASSAVTHDGQVGITENENNGNNTDKNGAKTTDLPVHEVDSTQNGTSTVTVESESEVVNSTSEGSSTIGSIISSKSDNEPTLYGDLSGSSLSNGTEIMSHPSNAQNVTDSLSAEGSNNLPRASDNSQSDANSTTYVASDNMEANLTESLNSSTNSELVASEHTMQSNLSTEADDGSESTLPEVNTDTVKNENLDTNGGADDETFESSENSNSENVDELQHDIPTQDKEEDHVDLDTLADIRTEGTNSEEAAEE